MYSVKISRKLFGQLNKLQINDRAHVIMGDETWVYFENLRSAMWIGANLQRSDSLSVQRMSCFGCVSLLWELSISSGCRHEKRLIDLSS
jgi:hypothetical protein